MGDRINNKKASDIIGGILSGAEGRTRTGTSVNPLDFESSASANSATSAFKCSNHSEHRLL